MASAFECYKFALDHNMWYDISNGDILTHGSAMKLIKLRQRVSHSEHKILALNVMQFGPFVNKMQTLLKSSGGHQKIVKLVDKWSHDTFSISVKDRHSRAQTLQLLEDVQINTFLDANRILIGKKDREAVVSALSAAGNSIEYKSKELEEQQLRQRYIKTYQFQMQSHKKQDRIIKLSLGDRLLFAICDGHGDDNVIQYIDQHKEKFLELIATPFPTSNEEAMTRTSKVFTKFENEMRKQIDTLHSGSTMVFAAHDLRSGKVFFGYIGDSRAVFQQSPEAPHIATPDHKPSSQAETMRIRTLGGYVSYNKNDVPRVNGNLATSRSFGDGSLKHNSEDRSQDLVSVTPDIMGPYNFGPDSIYFLGSDGLFDEVQNAELVKFVRNGGEAANVGSHFCSLAKQRGSRDDISIGFAFGV